MYRSILIVCVGNICRSPMAEYQLRAMINSKGVDGYVSSAGLGALVGYPADENAIEVMSAKGIDIKGHRARQLHTNLVKDNELILAMEKWQIREIELKYPFSRGRVHLLGKWDEMEIEDPYKKSKKHFEEAFDKIDQACFHWCEKLCLNIA